MGRKPAMSLRRISCIAYISSMSFSNRVWERGVGGVRGLSVIGLTAFFLLSALGNESSADQPPCVSGLREGQRPGPYSAVVATGPQRGQSYCYICETADRPAAVVFARSISEPLGKLAERLDKAVANQKAADLRAWITFL